MEEWRSVIDYEGIYEVSNMGRVRSIVADEHYRARILKPALHLRGYLFVNLYKNGKRKPRTIHRLVAKAFIPNPDNLPEVNHKDEDKTNNNVENLEWCTKSHNCSYGTHIARAIETRNKNGGRSAEKIILQCDLQGNVIKEWKSLMEAHRNGFCRRCIQTVLKGKLKTYKKSLWILKSNYNKTN